MRAALSGFTALQVDLDNWIMFTTQSSSAASRQVPPMIEAPHSGDPVNCSTENPVIWLERLFWGISTNVENEEGGLGGGACNPSTWEDDAGGS